MSWVWWLVAAAVFAVGEMTLTTAFWLAPFAIGSATGAVVAAAGAGEPAAFIAFAVVTALILVTLRPIVAHRLISSTPALRTGGAALVGRPAVVLERISNREALGSVRIGSEVWTARGLDEDANIEAGTEVRVVEIRGATALVME